MPFLKKYIITGAPGTGKTTLINALEKEYPCMHEVSRQIIKSEQERGGEAIPWKDLESFAVLVYDAFVLRMEANPKACFTDRSPLDLIAYLRVEDRAIPEPLVSFPYSDKFHRKVFFAPTWEAIYHQDPQRLQAFDECLALEKALIDAYEAQGFEICWLPKVNSAERATFVKQGIKQLA